MKTHLFLEILAKNISNNINVIIIFTLFWAEIILFSILHFFSRRIQLEKVESCAIVGRWLEKQHREVDRHTFWTSLLSIFRKMYGIYDMIIS